MYGFFVNNTIFVKNQKQKRNTNIYLLNGDFTSSHALSTYYFQLLGHIIGLFHNYQHALSWKSRHREVKKPAVREFKPRCEIPKPKALVRAGPRRQTTGSSLSSFPSVWLWAGWWVTIFLLYFPVASIFFYNMVTCSSFYKFRNKSKREKI